MNRERNVHAVVPAAICEFLGRCVPFTELSRETIECVARRSVVAYFPKGTLIFKQGITEISHLYLIQKGAVRMSMVTEESRVTLKEYGGQGESFGGSSMVYGRKAEFDVEAVEDTFCLLIARDFFLELVDRNPPLADHYDETASDTLLRAAYDEQRTEIMGSRSQEALYLFNTRVLDVVKERPHVVEGSASVREVGTLMARQGVGSVLVRDPGGTILGMVTNQELKSRVVAAGLDYGTPVERIMVSPVRTVPALAFCFEALLTMVREQVDHLAVQHVREIIGVINAKDMMVHLGSSPLYVFSEITEQRGVEGLSDLSDRMPFLVRGLIEAGAKAASITQMLTVFADNLVSRILTIRQEELGPPPGSFCWLGLGSEGRREQIFRTDQDNALLIEPVQDQRQKIRVQDYFLALAGKVVEDLEETGQPRCRNNFMASNPRWCRSVAGWKRYFEDWIRNPMPPDIFLSTIFFDFRRVAGEQALADDLRAHVLRRTTQFPQFLKFFIKYFLLNEPPVSFFTDFLVEKDDAKVRLLDLKTRALTPFVEFARILSLRHGIHETNTLARLQALAARGHIPLDLYADASQAYEFDLHLTLVHQLNVIEAGKKPDNFVNPAELSELERRTLKFSFSVVERMMAHIRKEFL